MLRKTKSAEAEPRRGTKAHLLAAKVDEVAVALLVHVRHHEEKSYRGAKEPLSARALFSPARSFSADLPGGQKAAVARVPTYPKIPKCCWA